MQERLFDNVKEESFESAIIPTSIEEYVGQAEIK